MTDKTLIEWLYTEFKHHHTADLHSFENEEYLSILPNKKKLKAYLLSCDTNDFIISIIEIFKNRYPENHSYLQGMLQWDDSKEETIEGKVFRQANDIERMDFVEVDDDYWTVPLKEVKIKFVEAQPNVNSWVNQVLADKEFSIETTGDGTVYSLENELIKQIKVDSTLVYIEINVEKVLELRGE